MDPDQVCTSLRQIGKAYQKILDGSSQYVLESAAINVEVSKEQYDQAKRNERRTGLKPEPWGYTIHHDQPLRFIPSKIPNGIEVEVDVYCEILWADGDVPVKQDIKVRIWSQHDQTIFNPDRDSKRIEEELTSSKRIHNGRVVSRFHFDKADPNQSGPEYHLQFGGIPEEYELCWHPKKVNLPRFAHQPMELFLTCQMIAVNFFGDEYEEIKRKMEWEYELLFYQNLLLRKHYQECLKAIEEKKPLLDSLWVR
jgi:hypothetical protein